jgi:hypothetical protein
MLTGKIAGVTVQCNELSLPVNVVSVDGFLYTNHEEISIPGVIAAAVPVRLIVAEEELRAKQVLSIVNVNV